MIEQELVLLGLLKESPRHGYEIKKRIKEILTLFAGLDISSIYYPLQILERNGLVRKRSTRQGRRPPRIVYELTPKGDARFQELLNKSFLDFRRPQFTLDVSLYFLHHSRRDIARRRLRARMGILERLASGLRQMVAEARKKEPFAGAYILEHNLRMVETEKSFLEHLIAEFSEKTQ